MKMLSPEKWLLEVRDLKSTFPGLGGIQSTHKLPESDEG